MAVFSVWAPKRKRLEVVLDGEYFSMERLETGWWTVDVRRAQHGDDYKFRLDGDEEYGDPRSRWQPSGVHGPSRVVDFNQFRWEHDGFRPPPLSSALIYELHVGTFTREGSFEAAIEKLDHLAGLGVTHVELMPVVEFLGARGWGYDGVYPFAPHHAYGGPEGLVGLVDACHARGLAVILDVVYNHLGPAGNYLPRFGPYFTDRHKTPWGSAVNFDGPYSDDVREYFIDNAVMWLRDYRFDGLRLDAVHAIVDNSATPFLEELGRDVRHLESQLGRQLTLIAESDLNNPRIIWPHERDGFGFAAQWNDDFHHAVHAALTHETHGYYCDFGGIDDLAWVFQHPYLYAGRFSPHRLRSHGRPATGLNASSFIAYSQNHDQVGNRATGERLHQLLNFDQAKVAAALTLLSPYVPMLFQGEEWGASTPFQYFVDFHEDEGLAKAVAAGRKQEFAGFLEGADVPNPQSPETFMHSKLNWEELEAPEHREMLEWYRELVAVRRRLPALLDGRMDRNSARYDVQRRWLAIERQNTVLAVNLSGDEQTIAIEPWEGLRLEIASRPEIRLLSDCLVMPPHSVALVAAGPVRGPWEGPDVIHAAPPVQVPPRFRHKLARRRR